MKNIWRNLFYAIACCILVPIYLMVFLVFFMQLFYYDNF